MIIEVDHTEHMCRAWDAGSVEILLAVKQGRRPRTFEEWLADEKRLAGPPVPIA